MTNSDICSFCEKIVKTRYKAICCDLPNKWIHIKYNNLNDLDYEYLKSKDETWYCKSCNQENLSFYNKKINLNKINLGNAGIDPSLKIFLCQLNNLFVKDNNHNENLRNCKYRDIVIFLILMWNLELELKLDENLPNCKYRDIVIFPILMWNLELELKLEFDILGTSESRILKFQSLNTNVSLQNYVIEQTSTEATAGEALLYIN